MRPGAGYVTSVRRSGGAWAWCLSVGAEAVAAGKAGTQLLARLALRKAKLKITKAGKVVS